MWPWIWSDSLNGVTVARAGHVKGVIVKRLAILALFAFVALIAIPAAAEAHAQLVTSSASHTTTPTPSQPTAQPTPGGGQLEPIRPDEDSTSAKDALTITGFSVVAMVCLVLLIRAGLKSATAEDED